MALLRDPHHRRQCASPTRVGHGIFGSQEFLPRRSADQALRWEVDAEEKQSTIMMAIWTRQVTKVAKRTHDLLADKLASGLASGAISPNACNLCVYILDETLWLFQFMISRSAFTHQLRKIGLGRPQAALAAYLQLLSHILWDYSLAFRSDVAMGERLGTDFSCLVTQFGDLTGLGEMLCASLGSSEQAFELEGEGDSVDFRPVMDSQTLDFLQTVTEGRYSASHIRDLGLIDMIKAAYSIHTARLQSVLEFKRGWGLEGPVLSGLSQSRPYGK